MVEKRIVIVEGNTREENSEFSKVGINTHTESLIESINFYKKDLDISIANPSSDNNLKNSIDSLDKYDGMIWGGSSLNIYNDTPEIRRQIEFMKECQKKVKNILAICWGMQVAVTAAGGAVKKAASSHIGIANQIKMSVEGFKHPIYKNKKPNLTHLKDVCSKISKIINKKDLLVINNATDRLLKHAVITNADVYVTGINSLYYLDKKVLKFLTFLLKWDIRISLIVFAFIMLWYYLQNY